MCVFVALFCFPCAIGCSLWLYIISSLYCCQLLIEITFKIKKYTFCTTHCNIKAVCNRHLVRTRLHIVHFVSFFVNLSQSIMYILYIKCLFYHYRSPMQCCARTFSSTSLTCEPCFTGAHFVCFTPRSHIIAQIVQLYGSLCASVYYVTPQYEKYKKIRGYPNSCLDILLSYLLNSTNRYIISPYAILSCTVLSYTIFLISFLAMPLCSLLLCRLLESELIAEVSLLLDFISFYIIYKKFARNHTELSRIKLQ